MNQARKSLEAQKVMETGILDEAAEKRVRDAAEREIDQKVDRFLAGFDADYRKRLQEGFERDREA